MRDLFEQGKKNAPCIIFIDEIDAVGRHRGAGLGGGHDEREQTLNQLLVEMDGFESNDGVILIAATNRPDVLDPALLRPGRFDRRVVVSRPDVRGREGILQVHTRKIPLAEDVDISVLARATPGFSGADLANLVNEAALLAARRNQKFVMMADFESSKDKVLMGAERKSMIITDEEKKITAYHEAGHALLAALLPAHRPAAQGHDHPARHGPGRDPAAPHRGEAQLHEGAAREPHRGVHGRPHRRGHDLRRDLDRRPERHRAGHGDGAQDGLRVGHERGPGPAHLRQEGRADLPGQGVQPPPGLQRGHRAQDRRRDQAHRDRAVRARAAHPRPRTATRSSAWRRRCSSTRSSTPSSSRQLIEGRPIEVRARPRAAPPPPPREGKIEHEGGRAGGILPPPMPAPKPTS